MRFIGRGVPVFLVCMIAANTVFAGNVCTKIGNVTSIIPSDGDAAVMVNVDPAGCVCAHSNSSVTRMWIDIDNASGKSMFAAAMAAKLTNQQVQITFEDGLGQNAAGNDSIYYRYWLDCRLRALEIL